MGFVPKRTQAHGAHCSLLQHDPDLSERNLRFSIVLATQELNLIRETKEQRRNIQTNKIDFDVKGHQGCVGQYSRESRVHRGMIHAQSAGSYSRAKFPRRTR